MTHNKKHIRDAGFMRFNIKMLYLQGLWYVPPDPDIHNYLKYFSPDFCQLLLRYPHLPVLLKFFRRFYSWSLFLLLMFQVFVSHPVDLYYVWGRKNDVIENLYLILIYVMILTGMGSFLFQKRALVGIVERLATISKFWQLDNNTQRKLLKDVNTMTTKITTICHVVFIPLFLVMIPAWALRVLPKRKLFTRAWFPYDITLTPYYEFTMVVLTVEYIALMISGSAMAPFVASSFMYIIAHFDILLDKFKNIRNSALKSLKRKKFISSKKLNEMRQHNLSENMRLLAKRNLRISLRKGVKNVSRKNKENVRCKMRKKKDDIYEWLVNQLDCNSAELDFEMNIHLGRAVRRHTDLIAIVHEMSRLVNVYLTVMFLFNILAYGGTIVRIAIATEFSFREIVTILVPIMLIFLYFIHSFMATIISKQSVDIGHAAYCSDWLGATNAFKKSMLIVQTRSVRPAIFKPVGLDPLSLELFGRVLRIAYKMIATINSLTS